MLSESVSLPPRYRPVRALGAGGMGVVWLAHDEELDRPVAIKLMLPTLSAALRARERFEREARVLARLGHPHIVTVFERGVWDGRSYYVMEHLPGGDLVARLERSGRLGLDELATIAAHACRALDAAHQAGVIHRDVKPANLLIARDGTVKLSDFGVARIHDAPGTTHHGPVGTETYMAPEQQAGNVEIDGRADLFALGATLYHLATGHRPVGLYARERWDEVARELPPALVGPLRRVTELRREARYPDARAFAQALADSIGPGAAGLRVSPGTAVSPTSSPPTWRGDSALGLDVRSTQAPAETLPAPAGPAQVSGHTLVHPEGGAELPVGFPALEVASTADGSDVPPAPVLRPGWRSASTAARAPVEEPPARGPATLAPGKPQAPDGRSVAPPPREDPRSRLADRPEPAPQDPPRPRSGRRLLLLALGLLGLGLVLVMLDPASNAEPEPPPMEPPTAPAPAPRRATPKATPVEETPVRGINDPAGGEGRILVITSPPSSLTINRQQLGKSGEEQVVPAGRHTVEALGPEGRRWTAVVTVTAGKTETVCWDFVTSTPVCPD